MFADASGRIWVGVKLYGGPDEKKGYICQVICVGDDRLRVLYPSGSKEWKLRSAIVSRGNNWFVRKDDPALTGAQQQADCD